MPICVGRSKATESPFSPLREQIAVALVRFDGAAEAGVLAHGPEAPAIHGGIDATGERELAGIAEVAFGVPIRKSSE